MNLLLPALMILGAAATGYGLGGVDERSLKDLTNKLAAKLKSKPAKKSKKKASKKKARPAAQAKPAAKTVARVPRPDFSAQIKDALSEAAVLREKFAPESHMEKDIVQEFREMEAKGTQPAQKLDPKRVKEKRHSMHVVPRADEMTVYWTSRTGAVRYASINKLFLTGFEFTIRGFDGETVTRIDVPGRNASFDIAKADVMRRNASTIAVNLISFKDNQHDWPLWLETLSHVGYIDSKVWESV